MGEPPSSRRGVQAVKAFTVTHSRNMDVVTCTRIRNVFEQMELILHVALDPAMVSRDSQGDFVKCFDYFDPLQPAINCAIVVSRNCHHVNRAQLWNQFIKVIFQNHAPSL